MIKIMVVDDHPIFRQGIFRAFSGEDGLKVVAEAVDGPQFLENIKKTEVDVVLLDITMNGEWSLDYLKKVKEDYPKLPVIILSVYPEQHFALRYIKAGASGYVTKESPLDDLKHAVRKVASGGNYLSPGFLEKMAFNASPLDQPPHEKLTNREFQVFCLLATGKSLSEIADKLFVSVKTISSHRTNILQKLNMESNAEIIQYAILNQLI